jgi:hypothetical protein
LEKYNIWAEKRPEKMQNPNPKKDFPKSYRWRRYDLDLLNELLRKVNKVSPDRKIDATKLLRGALYFVSREKPEKVLKAIIETE